MSALNIKELATPLAIVIAGALVGLGLYFSGTYSTTPTPSGTQPTVAVDASKVKIDGNPYIGNPNAPVTIAYWFDYQCPFCKQNEEQSMPQLVKDYIDTGKVKVVFKDFQFLDQVQANLPQDSQTLGKFARAVWELAPDKFYDWHKAVFDNQGQEDSGWATHDVIMSFTTKVLGADMAAKVDALVKSKGDVYQKAMDADKAEAASFGINGTPGFIIGNQRVDGAVPYAQIKAVIDTALAAK